MILIFSDVYWSSLNGKQVFKRYVNSRLKEGTLDVMPPLFLH